MSDASGRARYFAKAGLGKLEYRSIRFEKEVPCEPFIRIATLAMSVALRADKASAVSDALLPRLFGTSGQVFIRRTLS